MDPRDVDTTRRPFVLVRVLTQACELACKHCRAEAKRRRHPDELSTGEGKGLLDDVRRFGEGQLVVLSGGDPLARDDVVEVYRDAELFRSLRDPDALRGKCGAYEYRQLCGGSRSRAFAYTGDPLESDPLCAHVSEGYRGPLPGGSFPEGSFTGSTDRSGTGRATSAAGRRRSSTAAEGDDVDPATARRTIRERAEEVKRRELRTALDRLEAHGSLGPEERRIVTGMATDIVDGILAGVESTLGDPAAVDSDTARTATDLFDPDA